MLKRHGQRGPGVATPFSRMLALRANAFLALLAFAALSAASDPASGSISPTLAAGNTWVGTATGTTPPPDPLNGDEGAVEGDSVDSYVLTVTGSPSDWIGKQIRVRLSWSLGVNDYDLYVRKNSATGAVVTNSGGSPPVTEEVAVIHPSVSGTGTYLIRSLYYAVPIKTDQYHGSIVVENEPPPSGRVANYLKGGMTFSPSTACKAPTAAADGEPSCRCDIFGNYYVAGIRGVPAGVDLWYFDLRPNSSTYDPNLRNPIYRGQPDSFSPEASVQTGADGGGDVDLAVGFGNGPGGVPTLAFTSLTAANLSSSRSQDRGITWTKNPLGNITGGVAVDDRQWMEFFGPNECYLLYRTLAPAVTQIQRSTDGGLTYGPAATAGAIGQTGGIDVDPNDGTVYISGSNGIVAVGIPPLPGMAPVTYTTYQVASDPDGVAHIFFTVKVANDGTVYVCYSNDHDIFIKHSTNKGVSWSDAVRVSDGPETRTSVFPWMETGPTPGSVGVVWVGTDSPTNDDDAKWKVFYAQSFDATALNPTFRQSVVTGHVIHGSNISEGGTLGNANRNLLDYIQISFDPVGAACIAFTDDHNDADGHTFVSRQIDGPSINGGRLPPPIEGPNLPAPMKMQHDIEDFPQDVAIGLLGVVAANDPFDILSVDFITKEAADGPVILAMLKVSDLAVVPNNGTWRTSFTANGPETRVSPSKDYSYGVMDDGDMFYVQASTSAQGTFTFTYGTVARNGDGSLTYTSRGAATGGFVSQSQGTITVAIAASKLNQYIAHGPTMTYGSVLTGLRANAFGPASSLVKSDLTRGGRPYTIAPKVATVNEGG